LDALVIIHVYNEKKKKEEEINNENLSRESLVRKAHASSNQVETETNKSGNSCSNAKHSSLLSVDID
jgi:hypothetical protein